MQNAYSFRAKSQFNARRALLVIVVGLCSALPVLSVFFLAIQSATAPWPANLARLVGDSLLLCLGTGAVALAIGVLLAWLVNAYDFPGRATLKWMALLPLALPGYIISFVYVDAFAFSGPVQTALRQHFNWHTPSDYWFPDIRSLGGACLVLALALFPYVYLAALSAFMRQPPNQIHVARTLGRNGFRAFVEITLPQARPALFVGVLLVAMECINDIGAATFFGIGTLTTAVYSLWFDSGDLAGAARIASLLVFFMASLVYLQTVAQEHGLKHAKSKSAQSRKRLTGVRGVLAWLTLAIPVFLGFGVPILLLVQMGLRRADELFVADTLRSAAHSLMLAMMCCVATLVIALALGFTTRIDRRPWIRGTARLASLGYALPGTVLAIGILVPFGQFDQMANRWLHSAFNISAGLLISGGMFALVFAYATRFLIIAVSHVQDGYAKIPTHIDDVARTLGRSRGYVFGSIHLPLLKPAVFSALLLVFVDAMKELPATLILRPFDFETLATRVFALVSLGKYESAAGPALLVVVAGLIPVIILARNIKAQDHGH